MIIKWRFMVWALAWLSLITTLVGCEAMNARPPIEAFANKLTDEAIIPAVKEGLSRGVEQLTIQAGAQGINPTYVINFEGKWVVGIEGRATLGVEGVAGQIQVSTVSPAESQPIALSDMAWYDSMTNEQKLAFSKQFWEWYDSQTDEQKSAYVKHLWDTQPGNIPASPQ